MTPQDFIEKWTAAELKERSAAQEHFIDLCRLLDEPTPGEVDPTGETYSFEKGAVKTSGAGGWADVWKRGHFGWEYKGPGKDLEKAFSQLLTYSVALENPPLLIVSDLKRIVIRTNWTNTVQKIWELSLEDLRDASNRQILKDAFSNPAALKPAKTRQELTEEAATDFAEIAKALRARRHDPEKVAHFINRMVFCMFAEDVRLLPDNIFTKMLERAVAKPDEFETYAKSLFEAMRTGGMVGFEHIEWFNGGLFDDDLVLPLEKSEIKTALKAAKLYWGDIDPSILGTLFERGLDPDKRSQLGAHYTDRDKIMMIIEPVIIDPLRAEWNAAKSKMEALMDRANDAGVAKGERTKAKNNAAKLHADYIHRLEDFRVLDPACGSGNFLYLALLAIKDLEHKANLDAEAMGLPRGFPRAGPECVQGIEINPYAAELARVSIWIGEIQWMRRNGFSASRNPILRPLDAIECTDALVAYKRSAELWKEAKWPNANVIIGNPPFLGANKFKRYLGDNETKILREVYEGRVPQTVDLVAYWFFKTANMLSAQKCERAGLVATSAVRTGNNLKFLDKITQNLTIFEAWSDEPWVLAGASVRVSIICFDREESTNHRLDGHEVKQINSDLTSFSFGGFASVRSLSQNEKISYQGSKKVGPFEIPGAVARDWLSLPQNPNGKTNADVLKRSWLTSDFKSRDRDAWIVDFGVRLSEEEAALYEAPFAYVEQKVKAKRSKNTRASRGKNWWRHGDPQPAMRQAVGSLQRYIVTPEVSSQRVFVWAHSAILPDCKLMVFARADAVFFGVLHSRAHELWAKFNGGVRGASRTYTPATTFETFPFPKGLTPDIPADDYADDPRAIAIAQAATRLNELREAWLNPSDLVERVPEIVDGYPDRIVPRDDQSAKELKKRTLTNLYNVRPAWLNHAHQALDEAVAAAYGWPADLSDDDILARLFDLNQARAKEEEERSA